MVLAGLLFHLPAQALDTIEVYEKGLSNIEAYSSRSHSTLSNQMILGMGYNSWLNPTVSAQLIEGSGDTRHSVIQFSNIATVYEGALSVDLVPTVDYTSIDEEYSPSLGVELNSPFGRWEPFLFTQIGDQTTGLLGLKYLARDGLELLGGTLQNFNDGSKPSGLIGLNFIAFKELEILFEVSHNFYESESVFTLGLIYTQPPSGRNLYAEF